MKVANRSVYPKAIGPCMGCADRYPGCHASCEKYKGWRKDYDAMQKAVRDEYEKNTVVASMQIKTSQRIKKRRR